MSTTEQSEANIWSKAKGRALRYAKLTGATLYIFPSKAGLVVDSVAPSIGSFATARPDGVFLKPKNWRV